MTEREVAKLVRELQEMARRVGAEFKPDPVKIRAWVKGRTTTQKAGERNGD